MQLEINTNFYINKTAKFLKDQRVFLPLTGALAFPLIYKIAKPLLDTGQLSIMYEYLPKAFAHINIKDEAFRNMKLIYEAISYIGLMGLSNNLYERFLKRRFLETKPVKWYDIKYPPYPYDKTKFQFILGLVHNETDLELTDNPKHEVIEEEGLFQNILNTGTIGQGKTISFLVPFTNQMIYYEHDNPAKKCAMLCLDVKGNFYKFVHAFAKECGRMKDVITLELGGKWKYNPLHKPNLTAIELANRIRYIMELFSGSNSGDAYWVDKATDTLTEIIKLVRLYNAEYVTFEEVHKLITYPDFMNEKLELLQSLLEGGSLNDEQQYNFTTARDYFVNEFFVLDQKIKNIIISEITRMTQPFVSTSAVKKTFCPTREEINFYGFEDVVREGQIVVWKINANKEPKVARLIAAYLKLDYQKEIMMSLDKVDTDPISAKRYKIGIYDEYQTYVTKNDAEFLSQSREPRSVTAACTQSYSSIKEVLKSEDTANMLLQSFVNKIWMRTDDEYTVKRTMNHIGKEEMEKVSTSITETSRNSKVSYSIGQIMDNNKNFSSSSSISVQKDYRFDEKFLMQGLDAYKAVCFLSTGKKIKSPRVVHLLPLFEGRMMVDEESGAMKFETDEEKIFKYVGKVSVEDIESQTVSVLKEGDRVELKVLDGDVLEERQVRENPLEAERSKLRFSFRKEEEVVPDRIDEVVRDKVVASREIENVREEKFRGLDDLFK